MGLNGIFSIVLTLVSDVYGGYKPKNPQLVGRTAVPSLVSYTSRGVREIIQDFRKGQGDSIGLLCLAHT